MARDLYTVKTRDEAIEEFERDILPACIAQETEWQGGEWKWVDECHRSETWNNWTDGKMTIYLPGGVSPADRGLAGDAWRKGSASESTGWAPSWKKEIGMLEKIAITDREEAITQAVSALRDEKYSHLYINQEDRREAAEHWIDEILANYAARGNIGIMETETGNNIVYGEIGF